jgi:hypothetical protein
MKKISLAILLSIFSLTLIIGYSISFEKASAEISKSTSNNITNKVSNFYAKGTINTVIYLVINNTLNDPSNKVISLSNITNGLNLAAKSLIDGNWTLNVNNGKVNAFTANLSSINADASNYHTHQLGNFTSTGNPEVSMEPNNITKIKGKMDVGLNGETAWKQVNSDIELFKNKTITITLDDKDTEDHFANQLIYGKIKSFLS